MRKLTVKDACDLLSDLLEAYQTPSQKAVKIRKLLEEHNLGRYTKKHWKLDNIDIDRLRVILSQKFEGLDEYPYTVSDIAKLTGKKNLTVRQQARKLNFGRFIHGTIRFSQQEYEQLRDYHPVIGTFQHRYAVSNKATVTQIANELQPYFPNWKPGTLTDRIRKAARNHGIGTKDTEKGLYTFDTTDLDRLKQILQVQAP
jgi:hypothetical protein